MKVRVYYNFHKKLFSVQDAKTRRVIAHLPELVLKDVEFKVYEAGRQRVLREKRKNVHAFVIGELFASEGLYEGKAPFGEGSGVTYNPYISSQFLSEDRPVQKAAWACLSVYRERNKILIPRRKRRIYDSDHAMYARQDAEARGEDGDAAFEAALAEDNKEVE